MIRYADIFGHEIRSTNDELFACWLDHRRVEERHLKCNKLCESNKVHFIAY